MPELGTFVINKVKNNDIYNTFKFEFLSPSLYARMTPKWKRVFDSYVAVGRIQVVTRAQRFIKAGVLGELDVISFDKLQESYMFATGDPISLLTLTKRITNNLMSWQKITAIATDYQEYACFVPFDNKFMFNNIDSVNIFEIPHGYGDFIVYTLVNNQLCDGRVVNGQIFTLEYNNINWKGQVETGLKEVTINNLPNIVNQVFDYSESIETKYSFAELLKLDLEAKKPSAYLYDIQIMNVLDKDVLQIDTQYCAVKLRTKFYLVYTRLTDVVSIKKMCIIEKYIIKASSYDSFITEVQGILGVLKAGIESSFLTSIGSIEELSCINNYTKNGFQEVNKALYTGHRLDFKDYLLASTVYTYLKRCSLKDNVWLYRGLKSKRRVYEGMLLKSYNFLSTSINFKSVLGFGTGIIMRFKETKGLEGLYINTISNSRNSEYEVLINAGNDIVFEKKVGVINDVEIWDCKIVPDKSFRMLKNQNKVIDTTLNILNHHPLRNYFYITKCNEDYRSCIIEFSSLYNNTNISLTFSEKNVIILYSQEKKKYKKTVRLSKDDLYLRIIKIFDKCLEFYQSDFSIITGSALYRIGCDVIFNISSKFVYEGFILLGQRIFTKKYSDDYEFKASITLNGDSDDSISILHKFYCTTLDKCSLSLSGKSDSAEKSTSLSGSLRKVDSLVEKVFEYCLQNFNLNYSRRVDKVITKIANYFGDDITVEKARDCIVYKLGETKYIYVKMDGTNVNYLTDLGQVEVDYFDNLNVVASKVFKIVV